MFWSTSPSLPEINQALSSLMFVSFFLYLIIQIHVNRPDPWTVPQTSGKGMKQDKECGKRRIRNKRGGGGGGEEYEEEEEKEVLGGTFESRRYRERQSKGASFRDRTCHRFDGNMVKFPKDICVEGP